MSKNFSSNDPAVVAQFFRRDQLTSARELKGYTKAHLAKLINKTPSAITQFESGSILPDAKTVASLSLALGMPPQYFSRIPEGQYISIEDCHFRSLRSASQQLRRQSIRTGELVHEIVRLLENEGVEFPPEQITTIKNQIDLHADMESIALKVRNLWGLGAGPIQDPIKLLESKGILILPLANACHDVDAFSTWINGRPIIMLAMHKSSSRTHFDVAHELAHLILHDDVKAGDPICEREADAFSSAFLFPSISFIKECPRYWNIQQYIDLKRRWRISLKALIYKAHQQGFLTASGNKRANIDLSRNFGVNEPNEWDLSKPSLLKQALEVAHQEGISLDDIADAVAVNKNTLLDVIKPIMD